MTAAKPSTAIYVHAGTYVENVKIPWNASGTTDAPIWLLSADGPQAATIVAATNDLPTIKALGVDNYLIKNFAIVGGLDGIQFSQSGNDYSNYVNNIVIQGNVISGSTQDGVKVSQANNAYVLDNVIHDIGTQEGVDFVGVTNGVISRNEIYNLHNTSSAIFAKGGSLDITISDNYVHDVTGDGISAGGWTADAYVLPGATYEAKNVEVTGNKIVNVGKNPVSVFGATDVTITDNYLVSNTKNPWAVYVTTGYPQAATVRYSSDVTISGNTLVAAKTVTHIDAGNGTDVVVEGNGGAVVWSGDVGPAAAALWTSTSAVIDAAAAAAAVIAAASAAASAASAAAAAAATTAATTTTSAGSTSTTTVAVSTAKSGGAVQTIPAKADPGAVTTTTPTTTTTASTTPWSESHAWTSSIKGTGNADTLVGTSGHDFIDGLTGIDAMTGGAGDDTYGASSSRDVVVEAIGGGVDTVLLYDTSYQLGDNVENLTAKNAAGATLFGNSFSNMLIGGAGADILVGGGGGGLHDRRGRRRCLHGLAGRFEPDFRFHRRGQDRPGRRRLRQLRRSTGRSEPVGRRRRPAFQRRPHADPQGRHRQQPDGGQL